MRFEGTVSTWNEDRGFGYLESTQGGEPIFVHISAWPRGLGRPHLRQAVSFEVKVGPKGKRAHRVQVLRPHRARSRSGRGERAEWGTATLFAVPVFLLVYLAIAILWKLPSWVAWLYLLASAAAFVAYAVDKAAAARGSWRTSESTLHLLSLMGGWPGALVAQQILRHKSTKQSFRQVFWATVVINVAVLVGLASPYARKLLSAW